MKIELYDATMWQSVLSVGSLAILLLLANLMRRKLAFVRKALIPTSVLAGFLGLLASQLGLISIDIALMEQITYHALAIGFIALSLRFPTLDRIKSKAKNKGLATGINSGMLIVSNYLMQGTIGLVITLIASYTFAPGFFQAAGILLPMGYGQGPGQANNIGSMYETFGFRGGTSFGLGIASAGFLWASIGGIAYLYYIKRTNRIPNDVMAARANKRDKQFFEAENEFPLSEPIDRLSLQLGLIALVYMISFILIYGLLFGISLIPGTEDILNTLSPLLWGFNFIIASSVALGMRGVLKKLQDIGIMTHQYPNNYLLNRISGVAFDAMIIAGISSISLRDIQENWLVFIILTTVGGILTLLYNHYMSKKIYPTYPLAGMLGMYGMMTGTASTGIMLLQQIDPNFQTPMSTNLITGSSSAIVFSVPILLFVGLAPQSTEMTILSLVAIFAYWLLLHFILLRRSKKQ